MNLVAITIFSPSILTGYQFIGQFILSIKVISVALNKHVILPSILTPVAGPILQVEIKAQICKLDICNFNPADFVG